MDVQTFTWIGLHFAFFSDVQVQLTDLHSSKVVRYI